jgi:hypothetical protein
MTAGVYLRSLRRAAHVPVTHMAILFGQGIMVVWEIESDRRAIPAAWISLLALCYRADSGHLAALLTEQNAILEG